MEGGAKGGVLSVERVSSSCFLRTRYRTKERGKFYDKGNKNESRRDLRQNCSSS
jgi:hypothetical protein